MTRANGEVTQTQEEYEASAQAKADKAKAEREAERQRIKEIENARLEGIRQNNERLAEERRVMQAEASLWYTKRIGSGSEDEDGKKKRKTGPRKKKAVDGEEAPAEDGEEKPKKAPKRKVNVLACLWAVLTFLQNPGGRSKKDKAAANEEVDDRPAPTAQDDSGGEDEQLRPAKKSRKVFVSCSLLASRVR